MTTTYAAPVSELATSEAWLSLKAAVAEVREHQAADGSIPDAGRHAAASAGIETIVAGVEALSPELPHDKAYHAALVEDLRRWAAEGCLPSSSAAMKSA